MFFLKVVDAQIEFPKNEVSEHASLLTLQQNGRDTVALRLDDLEAKGIADAATAVAKRFKDQTAAPGSEAALRKLIEGLQAGNPDYDLISSNFAVITRQQLPQLQSTLTGLGSASIRIFQGSRSRGR